MLELSSIRKSGRIKGYIGAVALFTFVGMTNPGGVSGAETRQHGAHVHGVGNLNIAVQENDVFLELDSPAANIIGFEHKPENDEQFQAVHNAVSLLKRGGKVFIINESAGCSLHEAEVKTEIMGDGHGPNCNHDHDREHDGHEEHASHDHDKEQNDEHYEEHEQEHDGHQHEDHDHSGHSDIAATYHFECSSPDKLNELDVRLFNRFEGFETIHVQLLTPEKQTAVELTPEKHVVQLR